MLIIKIDENDKQFLIDNIEGVLELIESDDVEGVLDALDGFMTEKGYGPVNFEELNENGRRAEHILDYIYYNN